MIQSWPVPGTMRNGYDAASSIVSYVVSIGVLIILLYMYSVTFCVFMLARLPAMHTSKLRDYQIFV